VSSAETREAKRQIERNVVVHDRVARKYERLHGEIFNEVEQGRLAAALARARDSIRTGSGRPRALDFGCGSGNLTRHLLDLGFEVTAADVSPGFLKLVGDRFLTNRLTPLLTNGRDLAEIPDASFDLVAAYSVLHHIPDYLAAVGELARVCKSGGVVMLDHEPTDEYWTGDAVWRSFRAAALRFDWRKYLNLSNYVSKVRRLFDPRWSDEGDIHVWPDDHIEWTAIRQLLAGKGFEVVLDEDYLIYRRLYRREVYDRYVGRCTDTKVMIFRKLPA
jgi:ubiquinone/menaquinone biosynthesis C-methylase UbiE